MVWQHLEVDCRFEPGATVLEAGLQSLPMQSAPLQTVEPCTLEPSSLELLRLSPPRSTKDWQMAI